jgi:hypothetical protein
VGTNLSQVINEMRGEVCLPCIDCPGSAETNVSVLGALPAGDYALNAYSQRGAGWPGDPTLSAVFLFTVPDDRTPTLLVSRQDSTARIDVTGVPGARYAIEASANLTNWTSVCTNIGAPFTRWQSNIVSSPLQFYRVRIEGGKL